MYLDASAVVKRYVSESGSAAVRSIIDGAAVAATSIVSRAEVAAALARAVRLGVLDDAGGRRAHRRFVREWADYVRIPVTEALVARADTVAWSYRLRGYDAVHLASALSWQDSIGDAVIVATFDEQLKSASVESGLEVWPA